MADGTRSDTPGVGDRSAGRNGYSAPSASLGERASWIHDLFTGLYFSERLTEAKNAIEYRYSTHLQALLELRMNDRHVAIDEDDVHTLDILDSFLNYMEHVLGLERLGMMTTEERKVVFDYWPNIIGRDESMAAFRRYIAMCGYELISEELGLDNTDYLVVYGSLMSGLHPPHQPELFEHLELIGDVLVPGRLYEVNDDNSYRYPGLTLAVEPESRILHPSKRTSRSAERLAERKEAATQAELYRVLDAGIFQALDDWEGYDARDPQGSPYVRRIIRMLEPAVDAWIYVGNHADKSLEVDSNSWRSYVTADS